MNTPASSSPNTVSKRGIVPYGFALQPPICRETTHTSSPATEQQIGFP
jgi:hypothetical protein